MASCRTRSRSPSTGRRTAQELRRHVRAQLADFKVPRAIEFREALPKGGTGKILKAELREPFWEGREKHVN